VYGPEAIPRARCAFPARHAQNRANVDLFNKLTPMPMSPLARPHPSCDRAPCLPDSQGSPLQLDAPPDAIDCSAQRAAGLCSAPAETHRIWPSWWVHAAVNFAIAARPGTAGQRPSLADPLTYEREAPRFGCRSTKSALSESFKAGPVLSILAQTQQWCMKPCWADPPLRADLNQRACSGWTRCAEHGAAQTRVGGFVFWLFRWPDRIVCVFSAISPGRDPAACPFARGICWPSLCLVVVCWRLFPS